MKNSVNDEDYSDPSKSPYFCQFNSFTCGNSSRYRGKVGCVKLNVLQDDVGYLFGSDVNLTETELICLRSAVPLDPDDFICSTH